MLVPLIFLLLFFSTTLGLSDSEAILSLKKSLIVGQGNALVTWDSKNPPCTWVGVLCQRGSIRGLQMENLDLSGSINVDALAGLKSLRTLSFMNNKFEGPFPEFKKLAGLKSLFLSNNQFGGSIPGNAFEGMEWLKKVHLAQNKFTGEIPLSLAKLPKLLELRLDGNQFTGQIPEFEQKLQILNLSNNALSGIIPENLNKIDPKMFEGNKGLCGKPLETKCDSPSNGLPPQPRTLPTQPATPKISSSRSLLIIPIVVIAVIIIIILLIVIILLKRYTRSKQTPLLTETGPSSLQKKTGIQESHKSTSGTVNKIDTVAGVEPTKLTFLRQDRGKFDLQDLLKASAEILGSGSFGASYKAAVSSGVMMVVKRLKHMNNAGRDEFQEHMKRLGSLRHQNLLPIVAYYYRKDEKLLVCDFAERGSLAVNLHGTFLR